MLSTFYHASQPKIILKGKKKTEISLLIKIFVILDLHFGKLPLLYIEPTPKTEVAPHLKYFLGAYVNNRNLLFIKRRIILAVTPTY